MEGSVKALPWYCPVCGPDPDCPHKPEDCEHPNAIRLPLGGIMCRDCKKVWGF